MGSVEVPRDEIIEPLVVDLGEAVGAGRICPYPVLEGEFDGSELVLRRLGLAGVQLAAFVAVLVPDVPDLRDVRVERVIEQLAGMAAPGAPVGSAVGVSGKGGDGGR